MRLRLLLPFAVTALLVCAATAGAAEVRGNVRLLVVPVTWGPQPWTTEEIRRESIEGTAALVAALSYGRASLSGDVAPWIPLDFGEGDCRPEQLAPLALAAARRLGVDVGRYDRFAFVQPRGACPWRGLWLGDERVWANGATEAKLIAHELGHSWGLDHANAWDCESARCAPVEYGDRYSVMGWGLDGLGAYHRLQLGWISRVVHAREDAAHALAPLERLGDLPQALVVSTARGQYWLEYHGREGRARPSVPPPHAVSAGVVVRTDVPPASSFRRETPTLLLLDAAGPGRPALGAGESFRLPGVFTFSVAALTPDAADVRFSWLDHAAPPRPRIVAVRRGARAVRVRWAFQEDGASGLSHYEVRVGRLTRRIRPEPLSDVQAARLPVPSGGGRTVTVTAVDRAGNRAMARRSLVVDPG